MQEQPLLDQRNGYVRNVNANPCAAELLCCMDRGAAAAEWIKHHVARVRGGSNDAFQQSNRLLTACLSAVRRAIPI